MMTMAPLTAGHSKDITIRLGTWFRRELAVLLSTREAISQTSHLPFNTSNGRALIWIEPWVEGAQLGINELDPWFLEVCRRVRLRKNDELISGLRGTSKASRLDLKAQKGAVNDPWAPVHKAENKSFTLSGGDFGYKKVVDLLLGKDWQAPLLAKIHERHDQGTMALVLCALSRGNSKTEGLKSRIIPVSGAITSAIGPRQLQLHELAQTQVSVIRDFEEALKYALVTAAAGGERSKIKMPLYTYANPAAKTLDRFADAIFFEHLWARFKAQELGKRELIKEEDAFAARLWQQTRTIFDHALPSMPCPSLTRPRAEARAGSALKYRIRNRYPELFDHSRKQEIATHAE
jgi:CRISPR system Cascade subunit CasA